MNETSFATWFQRSKHLNQPKSLGLRYPQNMLCLGLFLYTLRVPLMGQKKDLNKNHQECPTNPAKKMIQPKYFVNYCRKLGQTMNQNVP